MQFPQAGQTFQGKYKLLEVLGRGGFAAVYKAIDVEIGREVAIKVLMPAEDGYDTSVVARFQREARIIAQLKDPHTITMFDFGKTDDDLLYMVFEYVAGEDLAHRLEKTGPLPPAIVFHVLDQLLHALREAHEAGVLHRDIKPANVLVFPYLDDDWQVKLLDFGIAKPGIGPNSNPVATLTRAGGIIGTPRYMSPEQLCGEELDAATDIYSLGLVAFEMLVGAPAIAGRDTRDNIVLQLATDPLVLPPTVPISPHHRRIIERMMARDAEKRFRSARDVIVAMRTDGSGPLTGPYGSITTPTRIGSGPHSSPNLIPTPESLPGLGNLSSSGEVLRRATTTGPHPPVAEPRRLSPLAILGLGAALGALIVVPIMFVTLREEPPPVVQPQVRVENPLGTDEPATKTLEVTPIDDPPVAATPDAGVPTQKGSGCGVAPQKSGLIRDSDGTGLSGREVVVYLPRDYDPHHRHSVVVVLHDRTRTPYRAISDMQLERMADIHRFIVVAPGGRDYNDPWEPVADAELINSLLSQVAQDYCVDERYRYAIGHNKGGEAVERVACLIQFSAIATTAHRGSAELACAYNPPVPHIHIAGERDRYHPIGGGSTCDLRTTVPLDTKIELWRKENRCEGKRRKYLKVPTGTCETFDQCEAPFVSCLTDGGRDWPGSASRDIQLPGCIEAPSEFPIVETVWDFFLKHGREVDG